MLEFLYPFLPEQSTVISRLSMCFSEQFISAFSSLHFRFQTYVMVMYVKGLIEGLFVLVESERRKKAMRKFLKLGMNPVPA